MRRYPNVTRFIGMWGTTWYYLVSRIFNKGLLYRKAREYLNRIDIRTAYSGFAIIHTPMVNEDLTTAASAHRQFLNYKNVREFI